MSHLILVRHGQSEWNLENRFTGWVDVDLAPKGKLEACKAGELIKELNLEINHFFSSYQKRAIETLKLILVTMTIKNDKIIKAWELNERHYGALTGLNKSETKEKLGEEQFNQYRRSWDNPPPILDKESKYSSHNDSLYKKLKNVPDTESLKNTYNRVIPYFKKNIQQHLKQDKNIIISAHGNSLRALCKYLFNISDKRINELEIPTGNPLIIFFDKNLEI